MRWLFVKESLLYPRQSGHDVHCFHLMQALAGMGESVSLATLHPLDAKAIEGGGFASVHSLPGEPFAGITEPLPLSKMQEKFRSYWGIKPERIRAVGALADELHADVVVVVGLNVLPYLGAVKHAKRVWYAGDEWVWHHLSQVSVWRRKSWAELRHGLIKGAYERAYAPLLDRAWMVSHPDRKAYRWVTGRKNVDVLANGIDAAHYAPGDEPQTQDSCAFWGRLDFGPNVQALEWFCKKVWPRVRAVKSTATFSIYGFQPTPPVRALVKSELGITLTPDLPDLRSEVRKASVVVLPFVSGGGIKNKLLEAAALGKAIVATPRTVSGLTAGNAVRTANRPAAFAKTLLELWNDADQRQLLGRAAREWVVRDHTWQASAQIARDGIA